MAKNDNSNILNSVDAINKELNELLRGESIALVGNDTGRAEEILNIHNRYNNIIQKDYQGIRSSKNPNDSTYDYITNAILGNNRDYSSAEKTFKKNGFSTGNKVQDELLKQGQLDRLFTMGDTQVASYFLSSSNDVCHLYDEIDSVCGYFYQLEEAILIIRDNVLRAEQVNEDISMNVTFPGITEDTSSYISIVKKALDYQNVLVKIRDHVVPKAVKYGNYYTMIIPYSEIGSKLLALNSNAGTGYGGYPFYESSTHSLFPDGDDGLSSCMEGVSTLFESYSQENEMDKDIQGKISIVKENLKHIFVCEDASAPDIEGLGKYKNLDSHITDGVLKAIEKANKELDPNTPTTGNNKIKVSINTNFDNTERKDVVKDLRGIDERKELGSIGDNKTLNDMASKAKPESVGTPNQFDTFRGTTSGITPEDLKHSKDMLGCHIKLVDPRQLIPIKIFDYIIGYYYFENYDFAKMGTNITDMMNNQVNFSQRSVVIDGIVDSVLKNLKYGDILKGDNQLRSMVLNCILYAEKRDDPIRIKFVRPDYIIPWKTNLDEHDNGQPVLTRSLLYARLYTSLMLFYVTAIITKSTDSEFYYLKESALDGQINNQISDLMDQMEDANIDPIQIANGNILHGNRAINKRYYLNMGTSEIKPFEMDVVSGQNIDLHNEFMTDLKKMAIGATSVSAIMVDYVDEIEYATQLGMANIKHLTRCNGIKKDFNPSLTALAKMLVRFCFPNAIPDNILDKLEITLRESKLINNNMTNGELNDNVGMCETMVKTWVGGDTTNPPEITNFIIEDMTRQLIVDQTPSAPWELMPDYYKKALLKAKSNSLVNKVLTKQAENSSS